MYSCFCVLNRKTPPMTTGPWSISSLMRVGSPSLTPCQSSSMPRKSCYRLAPQKMRFDHCVQSCALGSLLLLYPSRKYSSLETLNSAALFYHYILGSRYNSYPKLHKRLQDLRIKSCERGIGHPYFCYLICYPSFQ